MTPDPRWLRVEPASPEELRALIAGPDRFRAEFGVEVVPGYVEFDGVLEHSLHRLEDEGVDAEWLTYLFVHDADARLVGLGGFKGPPEGSTVEIGYGVAPDYRRCGLATEAARQLVERARAAGVATVIAHTLAESNASTRVLQHLGFEQTAEVDDPDDGRIWTWERATS